MADEEIIDVEPSINEDTKKTATTLNKLLKVTFSYAGY